MTFERRVRSHPGYDCRVECTHTPKAAGRNGHGIRANEWYYTLIERKVGALSLCVMTSFYPPTVDVTQLHDSGRGFKGAYLAMCTPYATSRELIQNATQPGVCDYLGRCYHFSNWYILADEMVEKHFVQDVKTLTLEMQQPRLWAALEEFFGEVANQIDVARHESGDLGWHQCPHCVGKGVLPGALS